MVQAANPDANKLGDVAKLLGDKWKGMTEEERQPCTPTLRINFLSDGDLTRAPSADEDKNKQDAERYQVIPPIGAEGLSRRPPAGACLLFLGPGFRLAAR